MKFDAAEKTAFQVKCTAGALMAGSTKPQSFVNLLEFCYHCVYNLLLFKQRAEIQALWPRLADNGVYNVVRSFGNLG